MSNATSNFTCCCINNCPNAEEHELSASINDHGRREEFNQKRGNWAMFDYHKSRRLELETKLRALKAKRTMA